MTDQPDSDRPAEGRARMTPYELVFTEGDFETEVFPAIQRELAEAGGEDLPGRDRLDFVRAAGDAVRAMLPDDAPAEAVDQYRSILFHAYRFWEADRRVVSLSTPVSRYLVEARPDLNGWSPSFPATAWYLQFPANLFWSSTTPDSPPEPVDGIFVTEAASPEPGMSRTLDLLAILGIHRGRGGFSVISLTADVGEAAPALWNLEPREGGDFSNALPGGDLSGLYSILTVSEVFKVAARAAWYLTSFPEQIIQIESEVPVEDPNAPPATRLAYQQVELGEANAS